METMQIIELNQVDERLEVTQSSFSGLMFSGVNLAASPLDNVNLSGAKMQNARRAGVSMQDVSLAGIQIADADLRNAAFSDCQVDGMAIAGVSVAEMMATYQKVKSESQTNLGSFPTPRRFHATTGIDSPWRGIGCSFAGRCPRFGGAAIAGSCG